MIAPTQELDVKNILKKQVKKTVFGIRSKTHNKGKKVGKTETELEKDLKNVSKSLKKAEYDIKVLIKNQRISSCLDNNEIHRFISNTEILQTEEILNDPENSPLKKRVIKTKEKIKDENEMKRKFDQIEESRVKTIQKLEKKFVRRFKNDEDINQTKLKFTDVSPEKRTKIYPYTVYKKNRFRILKSGNELYVKTFCGKGKEGQLEYKPPNKYNRSTSMVAQAELLQKASVKRKSNLGLNLTGDQFNENNETNNSLEQTEEFVTEKIPRDPEIEKLYEKWGSPYHAMKYLHDKRKFIAPPRFGGSNFKFDDSRSDTSDKNPNLTESMFTMKDKLNATHAAIFPPKLDDLKTEVSEDIRTSFNSKFVESMLNKSNDMKKSFSSIKDKDNASEIRNSQESKIKLPELQGEVTESSHINKFNISQEQIHEIHESKYENDEVESIAISEELRNDLEYSRNPMTESHIERKRQQALYEKVQNYTRTPQKFENIIDKATGLEEFNKSQHIQKLMHESNNRFRESHLGLPGLETSGFMNPDEMLKATADTFFKKRIIKPRNSRLSIANSIIRSRTSIQKRASILTVDGSRVYPEKEKVNRLMDFITNTTPDDKAADKVMEMQAKNDVRTEKLGKMLDNYRELNHLEAPILLSIYQYTKATNIMNEEEQGESIAKFLEEQKLLDVNVVKIKQKAMKMQLRDCMNRKRILRHDKMYNVKF